MTRKISEGVNIHVDTYYQPEYSNPRNNEYMFAYKVTIENHNSFPVKLISRHWYIFDSNGTLKEVEGEGVIGVQPVLEPGAFYQYISGCNLRTDIGKMHGTYLFENLHKKKMFTAAIPPFSLIAPFKLN